MRDQSCLVVKRVSGHSDRPQRRRYQARAPGAGALTQMCICVLGWNLVYVEKSACLQDTKAAPQPPSLSCGSNAVQGSPGPPGRWGLPTSHAISPRPPLGPLGPGPGPQDQPELGGQCLGDVRGPGRGTEVPSAPDSTSAGGRALLCPKSACGRGCWNLWRFLGAEPERGPGSRTVHALRAALDWVRACGPWWAGAGGGR